MWNRSRSPEDLVRRSAVLLALLIGLRLFLPGLHAIQHVAEADSETPTCACHTPAEAPAPNEGDGLDEACALCDLILAFNGPVFLDFEPFQVVLTGAFDPLESRGESPVVALRRQGAARAPPADVVA